jgi:PAS domain S-box-containing protein
MRPLRAFSIRAKLMAIVMLTTAAALLLSGVALAVFEVVSSRRALVEEMATTAEVLANNLTAALAFQDPAGAEEVLDTLSSAPKMMSACLYDGARKQFAAFQRAGPRICPPQPPPDGARFERDHLTQTTGVFLKRERVGTIVIDRSWTDVRERLQAFALVLLGILTAAGMAAVLLSAALQRLVSRPILELASTAKTVSEKRDYTLRAPRHTDDEVGVAVEAFNVMLGRIHAADSALRDAEEQSREQARLLRSILDGMGEGLVVCDEAGKFILWNPAATRLLGQDPVALTPEQWPRHFGLYKDGSTFYDANELPMVRALGGWEVTDREIFLMPPGRQDGAWIAVTARPVRDEDSVIRGALAVFRDVSERKRAEEQLRSLNATLEQRVAERTAAAEARATELKRSNEELEQFAYVASHDLQEPLRAVASYTQLLEQRLGERLDGEEKLFVGHVISGVARMRALINDLLDYSRVGRRPLQLTPTDAGAVLEAALADLAPAISESGAHISHGPLPEVPADPVQLGQLFRNLIANAIKFRSDAPPRIEVGVDEAEAAWRFWVRDNGVGIDPKYHERIFVIFQRLHGRARPGTGIGLAICRKILDRHGGRIWVESQVGSGATFFFTIPADNHGAKHA